MVFECELLIHRNQYPTKVEVLSMMHKINLKKGILKIECWLCRIHS